MKTIRNKTEIINIEKIEFYTDYIEIDGEGESPTPSSSLYLASNTSDLINFIKYSVNFNIPHGKYDTFIKSNYFNESTFEKIENFNSSQRMQFDKLMVPTSSSDSPINKFFGMISINLKYLFLFKVPKGIKTVILYDAEGDKVFFIYLGKKDVPTNYEYTKFEQKELYDEIYSDKIIYFLLSSNHIDTDISLVKIAWENSVENLRNKDNFVLRNDHFQESLLSPVSPLRNTGIGLLSEQSGVLLGNRENTNPKLLNRLKKRLPSGNYNTWLPKRKYKEGDRVYWKGKEWVSTSYGNLGFEPSYSPYWTKQDLFSEKENEYKTVIVSSGDSRIKVTPNGIITFPQDSPVVFSVIYPETINPFDYTSSNNSFISKNSINKIEQIDTISSIEDLIKFRDGQGNLSLKWSISFSDNAQTFIFDAVYNNECSLIYKFKGFSENDNILDYIESGDLTIQKDNKYFLKSNEIKKLSSNEDYSFKLNFSKKYYFKETGKNEIEDIIGPSKEFNLEHITTVRVHELDKFQCILTLIRNPELVIDLDDISMFKYDDIVDFNFIGPKEIHSKVTVYLIPKDLYEYNYESTKTVSGNQVFVKLTFNDSKSTTIDYSYTFSVSNSSNDSEEIINIKTVIQEDSYINIK